MYAYMDVSNVNTHKMYNDTYIVILNLLQQYQDISEHSKEQIMSDIAPHQFVLIIIYMCSD